MKDVEVNYLIVGGGVSGLMFANLCDGQDFLLLEKEGELGGYCRTIYQDGFIWDYAGHFFHFANEDIKKFFENRLAEDALVSRKKNTKIFYRGGLIDFPFQANIHQLEKSELIDCLYDLYFRDERENYRSFMEMLYGKFGQSITEKFLRPYNEKLYACDLNQLDPDAMGRFFPHANLDQIISNFKGGYSGSYNNNFLYPKQGAKVFVDALAEKVDKCRISLNEEVVEVDVKSRMVRTNKRCIRYKYLVNSMPLNILLQRTSGNEFGELGSKLSWNKVLVLNLGFDKSSQYKDIHWTYFPERDYCFYRVGFYNNILGHERLSLYVEIGFASGEAIDIDAQLINTIGGLTRAGIISDHKLISYSSIVMNPAYVHVDSSLNNLKVEVKQKLEEFGLFTIGRYGDWKYCSIEDSMLDALVLGKSLGI